MSLDLEQLRKLYPTARRVRIQPLSEEGRANVPTGVTEGIVRDVLPMPADAPDPDASTTVRFGVLVEYVDADGETGAVLLDPGDIVPHGQP